jgi:hypothetical protein
MVSFQADLPPQRRIAIHRWDSLAEWAQRADSGHSAVLDRTGGSTRSSAPHVGVRDRRAGSFMLLKFYGKHWHRARAAVVIPGAGCVYDPSAISLRTLR